MKKRQPRAASIQHKTNFIGLSHRSAAEPEYDFGLKPKRPSLNEDSTLFLKGSVWFIPAGVGFRPMWRVE